MIYKSDELELLSELNINYTSVITTIAYLIPHFLKLSVCGFR